MKPDDLWQVIALFILLFLSGFFSASETALLSLSKIRVRHMVEEKIKGAQLIHQLIENPNKLLGAILVGNNIVNIGASALATSLAINYFGNTGVGIATGIMTLLVLIFAEITPKSLAVQNAEKMALKIVKPIFMITTVLNPITTILIHITNIIIKLLGGKIEKKQPFITEEELKTIVTMSHEEGVLETEERQMIHNVFEFGDLQSKDVMIPRTDMITASINSTYDELLTLFKEERFSRIPIYQDTQDNIVGIIYIKDLIFFRNEKETFTIQKYMWNPHFTYEFKGIAQLFAEMRKKRVSIAIVLDEYGGTAGIITIEDLVEEIVGDIEDEYDQDDTDIEILRENEYIVNGSTKITSVNEILGINIESADFDSIGGFVIGLLGQLPEVGETIEHNNITFIIENVNRNRIKKLRIIT
jgi:putative hemolysin